jgi:hypothetical protein
LEISRSVVDYLGKQVYRFVLETEEGVWNEIELSIVIQKSINVWKINWHVPTHANPKYMGRRTYYVDNQKVLTITRAT